MDIYSLTSEYKIEVEAETNASLRSCELLFQIKQAALARAPSENSKEYKKQISEIRKEFNMSKSQFNKDVLVGATLAGAPSNNELRTMTKKAIYVQYCSPPKPTTNAKPKIDYKIKYEQQLKMLEYIKNKMGDDAWNKFLAKYHNN